MSTLATFRAAVQSAEIAAAELEGVQYVVAPVVMMVGNAVIRSMGSSGPEFVPLAELEYALQGWNYRPVMMNHPVNEDGSPALACNAAVLERYRFGYVFNAAVRNGKLVAEMWLDPVRAAAVGPEAVDFITRVSAGEVADVSVGCLISVEKRNGVAPSGEKYETVWHDLTPDHLAALPVGTPGACSVELGCGAPRAAAAASTGRKIMNALQRMLAVVMAKGDKGESDSTTRDKLHGALFSSMAGFDSIYEVYPASKTVIFSVYRNGEYAWMRSTYELGSDGSMTVSDAEEVMPETSFVPVAAADVIVTTEITVETPVETEVAPVAAPVAACGCTGKSTATVAPAQEGDTQMSEVTQKVKDLAGALIACANSPFKEEDRSGLEAMTEVRLSELSEKFSKAVETAPAAAAAVPLTEDQWLASAPAEIRALVSRAKVEEKVRHASLVATLKAAQTFYDETALAAMEIGRLEEMVNVLGTAAGVEKTIDHSARFISAPAAASTAPVDHTKSFMEAVAARRAAK